MSRSIGAGLLGLCLLLAVAAGCGPGASTKSGPSEVAETVAPPKAEPTTSGSPKLMAADRAPAKEAAAKESVKESKMPAKVPAAPKYLAGVKLIPRDILFGNPEKAAARLSHDGKQLAYLAPVNNVLNVWVGPADNPSAAKPVTKDTLRGIRTYFWAYTNDHILYLQDTGGDENWHIYRVDLATGETKDLTPIEKINAQIEEVSHKFPTEIMVGLNDRDPQMHDIYRMNIATGEKKLVQENKEGFTGFLTDEDYNVRFASRYSPDGGRELLQPDGKGGWKDFMRIKMEDDMTTSAIGFDKTGNKLYMIDSRGRNTGALAQLDLQDDKEKFIAENEKADIGGVLMHPTEKTVDAVSFNYTETEWQIINPDYRADFDYLKNVEDGEIDITSQTLDNQRWTVAFVKDDGPVKNYLYDRGPNRKATFLFSNRKELEGLPLVKMHPLVIKARDGLELVSYLSLPPGTDSDHDARPSEPVPMVLDVHGGPWVRDDWGYNPLHQWFANRGYAVLSVNYRGSTGFGKNFVNAGNREWSAKMHDDLVDAVEYCIKNKIADPKRVAIMGGSYGGYATLVGLTKTPDLFACGVDIVGPSNLLTLLETIPPYWKPAMQLFTDRVGDNSTDEGRKFLTQRSPLTFVDKIKRPLLIGQGANDPRVKQAEADQIVHAMQDKKIPVTYVLFPDEGHGFARPPNRLAFNAVAEAFLAENLGGRFEPIGTAFDGSTIQVPVGADDVPGLPTALEKQAPVKPDDKP